MRHYLCLRPPLAGLRTYQEGKSEIFPGKRPPTTGAGAAFPRRTPWTNGMRLMQRLSGGQEAKNGEPWRGGVHAFLADWEGQGGATTLQIITSSSASPLGYFNCPDPPQVVRLIARKTGPRVDTG